MNPLHAGDQLDHYRIEKIVARGGMASLFQATDLRSERTVAIKVPHPEMECDPVFFDRFRREAQIGREMNHPSVMKVLSEDRQSRVYMTMEWVEGRLLRQLLIERKKLPAGRATRIAIRILQALEYIHGHGVVHRDLKPENIMIDAADDIKLIDFGIAAKAGAQRLTFGSFSQLMGTPDYIAPEQIRGTRDDERSDIYAVGIMLYEMLTGKTPFRGPNPMAVMNDRLSNHPVPPRELEPEISPQLQEIIYRALERDPKNRYRSAGEFAADLEHPENVSVLDRAELTDWNWRREPLHKRVLFYSLVVMIPVLIFGVLIYVARHV